MTDADCVRLFNKYHSACAVGGRHGAIALKEVVEEEYALPPEDMITILFAVRQVAKNRFIADVRDAADIVKFAHTYGKYMLDDETDHAQTFRDACRERAVRLGIAPKSALER